MPAACPWFRVATERRGQEGGWGVAAAPHALPSLSVWAVRLGDPLCLRPCAPGGRAPHSLAVLACVWGGPWLCPRRGRLVVALARGRPTDCGWRTPARASEAPSPSTAQASASVSGRRGAPGAAGEAGRSVGSRARAPGGRPWCTARVRRWWGGTVPRAACACLRVRCVPWGSHRGERHGASGGRSGRDAGAQRGRTRACRRRLTAYARSSLRLPAAPDAWRSAAP
jgi:hypothetical protein